MKRKVGIGLLLLFVFAFATFLFTAQFVCTDGCFGERSVILKRTHRVQSSDIAFTTPEQNAAKIRAATKSINTEEETNTDPKEQNEWRNRASFIPAGESSTNSVRTHVNASFTRLGIYFLLPFC